MRKLLLALTLVLASSFAYSCSCAFRLLSDDTVRAADSIVIFQLVSAMATSMGMDPDFNSIEAKIQVVDQLKGHARPTSLEYSTSRCCGSRLDVGHYYAAFLDKQDASFYGHAGNLLHIGEDYSPNSPYALRRVVAGTITLEKAFGEFPSSNIMKPERPPSPPPPCPKSLSPKP